MIPKLYASGFPVPHAFCEGVSLVKRVHTLFGGVHRLATAFKEVEEVREEVQERRDEWEDEEVEENGRDTFIMRGWNDVRNTLEP